MKSKGINILMKRSLWAAAFVAGAGAFSLAADINTGDATLSRLEVKIGGSDILPNFDPKRTSYEIELDENTSSLATFSAFSSSKDAVVDININGKTYTNHTLGSLQGGENVITYTVKSGSSTETYTIKIKTPETIRQEYFTWKNANMYFVLTDRFYNGDPSNDESYHRHRTAGAAMSAHSTAATSRV